MVLIWIGNPLHYKTKFSMKFAIIFRNNENIGVHIDFTDCTYYPLLPRLFSDADEYNFYANQVVVRIPAREN